MVRGNVQLEKLWGKNLEIPVILRKINGLLNHTSFRLKTKKSVLLSSNYLNFLPKLEKGGGENIKEKISLKLRKFLKGTIPWYAPLPFKNKKKVKILKQKKWQIQKILSVSCEFSTI
mmetsp:Transcript_33148/g.81405  ORF Transcript_33148/g.81405 Transcript_33148/m.81405 type:complete len:117 (+) Transcript_33148:633-983(+)